MPHRILIVEDEAVVLSFAQTVLKSGGHEVMTARSVPEARQLLGAEHDQGALCLVVDVVLDQESGIAFAQECIARNPAHRVLLVSGYTDDVLMALPEHARRIAFLRKPFTRTELLSAVDLVCASAK